MAEVSTRGSAAEASVESGSQARSESESESEFQSGSHPHTDTDPGTATDPGTETDPGTATGAESDSDPGSDTDTEPEPEPEPGSGAASGSGAEPGSESKSASGSEPEPRSESGERMLTIGRWVVGVAAVVVLCLVIGGYGFGWPWTGLSRAVTLWDWMQALLLPLALSIAPILLLYRRRLHRGHLLVLLGVLVAFAVLVALGYLVPLDWTGFRGNTLWDWFELALLPLVVTATPVWVRANRLQRRHLLAAAAILAVFGAFVIAGYAVPLGWTGFRDNTAWDWLKLLLLPALLPTVVIPLLTSRMRRTLGVETEAGVTAG